jgi:hypothetical protein
MTHTALKNDGQEKKTIVDVSNYLIHQQSVATINSNSICIIHPKKRKTKTHTKNLQIRDLFREKEISFEKYMNVDLRKTNRCPH